MSKQIPAEDHLGRHVPKKQRPTDPADPDTFLAGIVAGVSFLPRKGEDALSTGWLEFYRGSRSTQADSLFEDISTVRRIHKNDVLALLNVGHMLACGTRTGSELVAIHDRSQFESHTSVFGIDHLDLGLADQIAMEAVVGIAKPPASVVGKKR